MSQQAGCTCISLKYSGYAKVTSQVLPKCLRWCVNTAGVEIPPPFSLAFDEGEEAILGFSEGRLSKAHLA